MIPKLKIYKKRKENNYFGRVYIPKEYSSKNSKQEVYWSTGTDDYNRAEKILNEKFNDLYYQIRHGEFVGNIEILSIINKFEDHLLREYELNRVTKLYYNNFKNPINAVKRFILERKIKRFERKTLKFDYIDFRKTENPNYKNTSLAQEMNALRLVMNYALDNDFIGKNDLPDYPKIEKQDNNRTFFRPDEYKKLLKISRKRCDQSKVSDLTTIQRLRLHYWIIFCVGSGLRVSEANRLTFGDIKVIEQKKERSLLVSVKKGKTGTREVRTETSSYYALIKLKEEYLKRGMSIDQSTNIFQTNTFAKSFNGLLDECDLKVCPRTNKKRDGKSLRQTYISWEIIKNKRNLHWIAKNCGNSIEVIQTNYANNLTQEDFFDDKIKVIQIV